MWKLSLDVEIEPGCGNRAWMWTLSLLWKMSLLCVTAVEIELAVLIAPAVVIEPALLISAGSIFTSRLNFHIPDIKKRDTFSVSVFIFR